MTETSPQELERALAAVAAEAPRQARSSIADRAAQLRDLAVGIDDAADTLVPVAEAESHLTAERLTGEIIRTTGQLRFFADVLEDGHWLSARIDTADPQAPALRPDVRSVNVPIGPALVFAASNFPFAFSVAGGDTAAALAAGCPVVVKAHPGHPRLSQLVAGHVTDVFGPAFQLVAGVEVGRAAVVDTRIKVSTFTGSVAGGRALFDLAAGRDDPIPFYGELGSVNPAVVTPNAARARAPEIASAFVESFTLGVGQFCTKPGLLFVPTGSDLLALIAHAAGDVRPAPMLGEWVHRGHADRLQELSGTAGVTVVLEGAPHEAPFAQPTVLSTTAAALLDGPRHLVDECFGPTALVIGYDDIDEVVAVAARIGGSLTASVHAEPDDEATVAPLLEALERIAGRIVWNGWTTGVRVGWATQHGGPWPSSTAAGSTSVGAAAIARFLRPVAFQNAPQRLLPEALRDQNTLRVPRRIDGHVTTEDITGSRA